MRLTPDEIAVALENIEASDLPQDAKEYLKDLIEMETRNEVYTRLCESWTSIPR
jgi:hypothetical protein